MKHYRVLGAHTTQSTAQRATQGNAIKLTYLQHRRPRVKVRGLSTD